MKNNCYINVKVLFENVCVRVRVRVRVRPYPPFPTTPLLVRRQLQLANGFSRANLPEEEREPRRHRMADRKRYTHFMATLFNKLIKSGTAPACWGCARIKLIYKSSDCSDPSNFRPIALTSVVGKLLHKILSRRLEDYLKTNNVIVTSVQKGFVTGLPGVFEHIYTLSAIMQDALTNKCPLMMTFLDLKNAFGSVPHGLMFNMLEVVKVPSSVVQYIQSFYSTL